jgi:SAM-dependent methyltransferase
MTAARVVEQDPETATYWLPAEHAASLTTAAGPGNLARMMQIVPMLAEVEQGVVTCFRNGGGLGYDHFPRFHALMAEDSAATHDAGLLDIVVPLVPGLHQRLTAGATLADIGCGSGHAVNLLGRAYSKSTFVGYDFSDEAVAVARSEAIDWGLTNVTFVVQDVASLDVRAGWDFATAFDAIHDQADPVGVLANIAEGLRPDGAFLMVDIHAASRVNENLDIPWATFLYTVSLMHCMTVSLALDGVGLGTVWGHQTATRMLGDAGFDVVAVHDIETDPFNSYFVAIKTVQ